MHPVTRTKGKSELRSRQEDTSRECRAEARTQRRSQKQEETVLVDNVKHAIVLLCQQTLSLWQYRCDQRVPAKIFIKKMMVTMTGKEDSGICQARGPRHTYTGGKHRVYLYSIMLRKLHSVWIYVAYKAICHANQHSTWMYVTYNAVCYVSPTHFTPMYNNNRTCKCTCVHGQ